MNTDLLFYLGCIPARTLLALNIKKFPREVTLVPAFGFLYKWLEADQSTGFFGSPIWWQKNRILHSIMWFSAYIKYDEAETFLLGDVGLSLVSKLLRSLEQSLEQG